MYLNMLGRPAKFKQRVIVVSEPDVMASEVLTRIFASQAMHLIGFSRILLKLSDEVEEISRKFEKKKLKEMARPDPLSVGLNGVKASKFSRRFFELLETYVAGNNFDVELDHDGIQSDGTAEKSAVFYNPSLGIPSGDTDPGMVFLQSLMARWSDASLLILTSSTTSSSDVCPVIHDLRLKFPKRVRVERLLPAMVEQSVFDKLILAELGEPS